MRAGRANRAAPRRERRRTSDRPRSAREGCALQCSPDHSEGDASPTSRRHTRSCERGSQYARAAVSPARRVASRLESLGRSSRRLERLKNQRLAIAREDLAVLVGEGRSHDHYKKRTASARMMLGDILEPPRHADTISRQHGAEKFVVMAAADHTAAGDRKLPRLTDIAVFVGLAMRVLVRFAYEGRRRDYRRIAGLARVRIVYVERIVAHRKREVANRGAPQFLGRMVGELATDPGSQVVRQQRGDGLVS